MEKQTIFNKIADVFYCIIDDILKFFDDHEWMWGVLIAIAVIAGIGTQTTFIVLKALGIITWSWWTVFIPVIMVAGYIMSRFMTAIFIVVSDCSEATEFICRLLHILFWSIGYPIMIIILECKHML